MSVDRDPRLRELGAFLRARRAAVRPGTVGLDDRSARRQVPGLRREEVADLAYISRDYYVRIEQGRVTPSAEVLDRLASVLRLNDDQKRYARRLLDSVGADSAPAPDAATAAPELRRLLDRLTMPGIVIGARTSILAWNDAATALFIDFGEIPTAQRTYARLIFSNPVFQSRFRDLRAMRQIVVGILRASAAVSPSRHDDSAEVAALSQLDPTFRTLWGHHDVRQPHGHLIVPLTHPKEGDLVVEQTVLQSVDKPEQRLLLFVRTNW